jgi:hypothetical protein
MAKSIKLGLPYNDGCCIPVNPVTGSGPDKLHYPELYIEFKTDPELPEKGKFTIVVERQSYKEDDRAGTCSYCFKVLEIVDVKPLDDVEKAKQPDAKDVLDTLMHEYLRKSALKDGPDSELADGETYGAANVNGGE